MPIYMWWAAVPVTGISLNTNTINLSSVWATHQLTATVTPNNASEKGVIWTSSDTSVALVSASWLVTCVSPWACTITATTVDWGYTATCTIDPRALWDETYMANSTTWSSWVIACKNNKIIRPSYWFGWGNGNYTKGTENWYDVLSCTTFHGNLHIWTSENNWSALMAHSKVKIVFDYFNIWANQSRYTNEIFFGSEELLQDTSSSSIITVWSKFSGVGFEYNTWYSMTQIINRPDMSCTTTIKNIWTQQTWNLTYTKTFRQETNSTYIINWWGKVFIKMSDDQEGWPVSTGNIHIYYM